MVCGNSFMHCSVICLRITFNCEFSTIALNVTTYKFMRLARFTTQANRFFFGKIRFCDEYFYQRIHCFCVLIAPWRFMIDVNRCHFQWFLSLISNRLHFLLQFAVGVDVDIDLMRESESEADSTHFVNRDLHNLW